MAETATVPKKRPAKTPPKPTEAEQIETVPKQISFFQRIAAVPAADWGTRAKVRVYRLEPLIDQTRSSGKKYITIYDDGPPDEERIKQDHGSGRYRLYFGLKSAGANLEKEIDSVEIDILDPRFPPRLDLGDWLEDPKNRKWAWAKKILQDEASRNAAAQPAPPQQAPNPLDAFHVFNEIQDSVAARYEASKPLGDPIDSAVKIIQLTKGGGETVLMEMFRDEMRASRARVEKLEDELRARNNPPPVAPADPFAQLTQMAAGVKQLKDLGLFGSPKETEGQIAAAVRSRMGPWMEFFQPVLPEVAGIVKAFAQPLAHVMAQKMMQPKPPAPGQQQAAPPSATQPPTAIQPPVNGHTPQPQQAAPVPHNPEEQSLLDFINAITPRMLNHLHQGIDGGAFAAWVADGYSLDRVQQMQLAPPSAIVDFYKQTPYWQQLADREASFVKFLEEFNAWKPEEDDEDTPTDGTDSETEEIG